MTEPTFGSQLRELRIGAKINLREFAKSIGMDAGYLSRMENNHTGTPKEETVHRLVDALCAKTQINSLQAQELKTLLLKAAGYASHDPQTQVETLTKEFRVRLEDAGFPQKKIDQILSRLSLPLIQKILRGEELLEDVFGDHFTEREIRRLRKAGEEAVEKGFRTDSSTFAQEMLSAADYLGKHAHAFFSSSDASMGITASSQSYREPEPEPKNIKAGPRATLRVTGPLTRDQEQQLRSIGQLIESILKS